MAVGASTLRSRTMPLLLALALVLGVVTAVQAATPDSGTVGPTATRINWDGKDYVAAAQPGPTAGESGCPGKTLDPNNAVCDYFTVTVDVAPSYWATHTGGLEVSISWPDAGDDFDLYLADSAGNEVASSASGGTAAESLFLPEASGTYEVRVVPFLVDDTSYVGSAVFVSQDGTPEDPEDGGPAVYNGVRITGALPATAPQSTPVTNYTGPPLVLRSTDVGREAAEPTIAVDRDGVAFYAAATFDSAIGQAKTEIRRSRDGGLTWDDATPRVAGQTLHPQTLDPYVYVEEDSGRLFDLDLLVATSQISYSDDQGENYVTRDTGFTNTVNDHQTIFAGPVPAGSGLTVTDPTGGGFREIVYYCFNRVTDSNCSRSLDGGFTFTNSGAPAYLGFDPAAGGFCGGLHGHVATDPAGNVYLPKGHCGFPWVSVSNNAGTTWTQVQVSDKVDMPDNQSSVASDLAGNLYYVWYDSRDKLPYLATSTNRGLTWSKPLMIAPPGVDEVQWPTVAAGAKGRIVVAFPGTTVNDENDLTRPWNHYVTVSTNALAANPLFVSNISNPSDDPVHRGDCPGRCGNMLDFLDAIVSPFDGDAWATVTDTCTAENNCNTQRVIGFDGDRDNASSDMRGIAVRQVSGPELLPCRVSGIGGGCGARQK